MLLILLSNKKSFLDYFAVSSYQNLLDDSNRESFQCFRSGSRVGIPDRDRDSRADH